MNKPVTIGELLQTQNKEFDPMNLDTSELRALSESVPKDGNIDLDNAEVLATKFLRGYDLCSELVSVATAHVGKMDALKKKAYGYAATVKATNAGIKAAAPRAWYADQDDDYVNACNKHVEAQAFLKWINGKCDSFKMGHYLCKKILDRAYTHQDMSSWNGSPIEEEDAETKLLETEKNEAW